MGEIDGDGGADGVRSGGEPAEPDGGDQSGIGGNRLHHARQSVESLRTAEKFVRRLGVKPKGDGDDEISLVFRHSLLLKEKPLA
jgi:hypothetical protein